MIDLHTHILPGIDDGPLDMDESIEVIKRGVNKGFTKIVVTPHYIEGTYNACNEKKKALFENLKKEVVKQGIGVELYLGNEVFITENIINLINKDEISTINGSKYVLIEFPRSDMIKNMQTVLFKIFDAGYIPIVAHPERYCYVQRHPNILLDYIEQGILFQSNLDSLNAHYGKEAQKSVELLLKHNMIHIMASDAHRTRNLTYDNFEKTYRKLKRIVGKDKAEIMLNDNPLAVLENRKVEIEEPREYKKSFWEDFI